MAAIDTEGQLRARVGARIRALREQRRLTQTELARRLGAGVDSTHVSRWERGRHLPSWGYLIALAECFEVRLGELIDPGRRRPDRDRRFADEYALGLVSAGPLFEVRPR